MTALDWWPRIRERLAALAPPAPPEPGLYTYPVELPGGRRRIHLRIESDGSGVLFVDVTDVIHLNPTAAEMAHLALDGLTSEESVAHLRRRFPGVEPERLRRDVAEIARLVDALRSPAGSCPTCAVAERLTFQPLFSTPVQAPYKADVALTYACNNACSHCYNEPGRFEMPTLARAEWFRALEILAGVGVPHVIFTGGEPTLHPDLVEFVRYADGLGLVVGMNTNGRRLAHASTTEALAGAGLNHVQVTLESSRAAVHDAMVGARAFEQTVRGIEAALDHGIHTITNTTLTRQNQAHALEVVDFVHELGLRTFAMNGIIHAGGGRANPAAIPAGEMASLLTAVRDRAADLGLRFLWYTVTDYCRFSPLALNLAPKRCNAAEYSICVEPNGDVLPCQSYYVPGGNLLEDPWEAIWTSDLFLSFRDREQDPEAAGLPPACRDCPDLSICGGGCRLEHEARAGLRAAERGCGRSNSRGKL